MQHTPGPCITLSRQEHSLLEMDIIDVGTTPESEPIAEELRQGRLVHVTPALLAELREFADRDDDPREHRAYRKLLAKARAAIAKATGG